MLERLRGAFNLSLQCSIGLICFACSKPPVYTRLVGQHCNHVPLRVEKALPIIQVKVAGEELSVLIDTGSAQSITLLPEDIARLGVPLNGRQRTIYDAQGNSITVRGFTIPELRIGNAILHGVSGWEARRAPGWEPPVKAGHIGRGLIAAFRTTIDIPRKNAHFDQVTCPRPKGAFRVPIEITSDGVTSKATIDRAPITLIWDTAATFSILKPETGIAMRRYERDGQRLVAPRSLQLGGFALELEFALVAVDGLPADGLIGFNLFRRHAVTFDLANSVVLIGRPDPGPELP